MFEDINKIYFLAIVIGVTILYHIARRHHPIWIGISSPGKPLQNVGYLDEESIDLVEMKLTNMELDKPVTRVKSDNDERSVVWVLNGDVDDDANQSDYRMRGYVTSEGLIYRQHLKNTKPVLVGYTAQKKHPETPTTKGKRSWKSLWLDSELYAFEGSPSDASLLDPMKHRVGYVCLSGISFHNKRPVTLEAKACASAFFYRKYGPKPERNNIYKEAAYGWNDTVLLTSIIYSILFLILYFVYTCVLRKPLLGDDFAAVFILSGCYFALWSIIRQIKIDCIERSHSFQPQLDLLNKGLGLGKFDAAIVTLCGIAAYYTLHYYDYDLIPLIFSISYGVSKNALNKSVQRPWKIITNYEEEPTFEEEEEELLPAFASILPPKGEMIRTFDWDLDSSSNRKVHGNIAIRFSLEDYNRMRQGNPYFSQRQEKTKYEYITDMFQKMISEKTYSERVRYIASYIHNECNHTQLDEIDRLQFALDFVQEPNIDFILDRDSKSIQFTPEYVRFPDETLYDQEGDSDCKAMLAAMILYYMGYNVLYLSSDKKQHSAIGVELKAHPWLSSYLKENVPLKDVSVEVNHRLYIYCETTGDGYRVGDLVDDMRIDDFETRVEFLQMIEAEEDTEESTEENTEENNGE